MCIRSNTSEYDNLELESALALAFERGAALDETVDYELLSARGITAPAAQAGSSRTSVSYFLPDSIGKIFHPNTAGHEVIASFATDAVRAGRAEVLGIAPPGCVEKQSEVQPTGWIERLRKCLFSVLQHPGLLQHHRERRAFRCQLEI